MTYHDRTPAQLDVPSSLLPHLFRMSSLTTAEIRSILGVSPQVMEEYKLGRGEFSPFKFPRLAEVSGLDVETLHRLVDHIADFDPANPPKAGDKVQHPFRGAMRIEEIRGRAADVVILENERKVSGIPIVVFCECDVAKLIALASGGRDAERSIQASRSEVAAIPDIPAAPTAENRLTRKRATSTAADDSMVSRLEASLADTGKRSGAPVKQTVAIAEAKASDAEGEVAKAATASAKAEPRADVVSREEAVALIRGSGMNNSQIAKLFGISDSMIGFYLSGRRRMPRHRYDLLSDAVKRHLGSVPASRPAATKAPDAQVERVSPKEAAALIRGSGLTHGQIASLLGLSRSMVGFYISGRNLMPRERFDILAAAAKVQVDARPSPETLPDAADPEEDAPLAAPIEAPAEEEPAVDENAVSLERSDSPDAIEEAEPVDSTSMSGGVAATQEQGASFDRLLGMLEALAGRSSETVDLGAIEARLAAIDGRLARIEALLLEQAAEPKAESCKASKILAALAACAEA